MEMENKPSAMNFFPFFFFFFYIIQLVHMSNALQCDKKTFATEYNMYSMSAAAAANSLQSCPTLCDPIDGSSPNQSGTVTQNSKEKLTQAGV